MATEPNTGLTFQEAGSLTTDALHNQVVDLLAVWLNCVVLSVGQAAPTGSEVEGDRYIVGTGTGVFAGHDDEMAMLRGGTWQFHAPPDAGVPIIKNRADGSDWECVAGVWSEKAGGGGDAADVDYDNATSGLAATNVQDAIDEIAGGGGGGGGMVLLGSAVAGVGGAAILTVSGIAGGYGALKLVYNGRGTKAATYDDLRINFNGDTGANYNCQLASFTGGGGYFSTEVNNTYGNVGFVTAASAAANSSSVLELMVPNYANSVFDKSAIATYAFDFGTTSGGMRTIFWHPSTPVAITSVALTMPGGGHVEGSKLSVYGLP